jgi:type IV pilus assembly protein PilO
MAGSVPVRWWRRPGAEIAVMKPGTVATWRVFPRLFVLLEILLLAFAMGYVFFVTPQLDELAVLQGNEAALKDTFETRQRKVAALEAYRAQIAELERTAGPALTVLPARVPEGVLLELDGALRRAGVVPARLQLGEPRPKEFYAQVPVTLSAAGTYRSFIEALRALRSVPALPSPQAFDLAIDPSGGGHLTIKATLHLHRYLDDAEIAAAAPKKKKKERK